MNTPEVSTENSSRYPCNSPAASLLFSLFSFVFSARTWGQKTSFGGGAGVYGQWVEGPTTWKRSHPSFVFSGSQFQISVACLFDHGPHHQQLHPPQPTYQRPMSLVHYQQTNQRLMPPSTNNNHFIAFNQPTSGSCPRSTNNNHLITNNQQTSGSCRSKRAVQPQHF